MLTQCQYSRWLHRHTFFTNIFLKKEKVRETVFACSYGLHVESLKQKKNGQKSRDTVPLKLFSENKIKNFFEKEERKILPNGYLIINFLINLLI